MTSVDDVLQRVARGELTPDEGLAALDRLGVGLPDAPLPPGERPADDDGPDRATGAAALDDLDDPRHLDEPDDLDDLDDVVADLDGPADFDDLDDVAGDTGDTGDTGDIEDGDRGPAPYPFPTDVDAVEPEADVRGPADGDAGFSAPGGAPGAPPPPPPGAAGGNTGRARSTVRVLRLRVPARAVAVYADPAVAEVQVASGPCALRHVGDALVVEHARWRGGADEGRFRFVDQLPRKVAAVADDRVILRVNPAILLDIEQTAGSLKVWGCSAGLRLRMTAGSAKIDRVEGPVALDLHSSSLKGSLLVRGQSSLRCESSSVKLTLLPGSDVRIDATNRMGKLVLPTRRSRTGTGERATDRVGAGRGRLAIDARMSSVMIGAYR